MREIKKLTKAQLKDALSIAAKAYPIIGINTQLKLDDFATRILEDFNAPHRGWYGLFEDGLLLGNMVLYDFTVNYYGNDIKARGIGFVAVEFLHKKQKVCREMLHWYLEQSLSKKYPMATLYAFKPEFYKKMGYGYGIKFYNYVTNPSRLPDMAEKYPMDYLDATALDEVTAFYDTLYKSNHGMIRKRPKDIEAFLKGQGYYIVGYRDKGTLVALLILRLTGVEGSSDSSKMSLDILFTNSTGLKAALSFLKSQADQISEIAFSTPYANFFYNLADIRHLDNKILKEPGYHHTADEGMGIMYRSLDPEKLLLLRPCSLDNLRIRFRLQDSFMDKCHRDFVIAWKDGKGTVSKSRKHDLELILDVSDFSSWVMNAINLTMLHSFGLVQTSDASVLPLIDKAFYHHQTPICLERF